MSILNQIHQSNKLYWTLSEEKGHTLNIDKVTRGKILDPSIDLSDIFEETKVLGKGKSGEVTLVKDQLDKPFAIKKGHGLSYMLNLFHEHSDSDDSSEDDLDESQKLDPKALFQACFDDNGISKMAHREFKKSLRLDHPCIVKVDSLFAKLEGDEVSTYLLMEYIDGKELSRLPPGSLERVQAYKGLDQLLESLSHLLDRGLVPTDLHGDNIIVSSSGVRLVDLEGHETFEEAQSSDCADPTLRDRLTEIANLFGMFAHKSVFEESEQTAVAGALDELFERKDVVDQLEERPSPENAWVLKTAIEEIRELIRSFIKPGTTL